MNEYPRAQASLEKTVVDKALARHPEHAEAIKTHDWSLDLSDMVWECAGCLAVLHHGQRRFGKCSRRWGAGLDNNYEGTKR